MQTTIGKTSTIAMLLLTPLACSLTTDLDELQGNSGALSKPPPEEAPLDPCAGAPVDDGLECTVDTCTDGQVTHALVARETPCGAAGHGVCDGAGECVECLKDPDCAALRTCSAATCVCDQGACVVDHCIDGEKSGDESDVDCGGSCAPCEVGRSCASGSDCESLSCNLASSYCMAPTCDDGVKNGDESDVDCGGDCGPCGVGDQCDDDSDCIDLVCGEGGTCAAAACDDGVKNGGETAIDCGGDCTGCEAEERCNTANDCKGDLVCRNGTCAVKLVAVE